MSKVYSENDRGQRRLHYIECDRCDATIEPHADIANSGWTKRGWADREDKYEQDLCPACSA